MPCSISKKEINLQGFSLKVCCLQISQISQGHFSKDYTRWAVSFIQMKKGNTFTSLFPQSLPAKKSPHVCRQLKIGLSAWGNAQAQSHYQTKLSSDVEPVYFCGVKKRGISSLCNWRLERRVGAQRLGDYGKMSLSWTFSSLISRFAIFFYYITQFSLSMFPDCSKDFLCRSWLFLLLSFSSFNECTWCCMTSCYFATRSLQRTIYWNTTIYQQQLLWFCCYTLYLSLGKYSVYQYCVISPETVDWWTLSNCQSVS